MHAAERRRIRAFSICLPEIWVKYVLQAIENAELAAFLHLLHLISKNVILFRQKGIDMGDVIYTTVPGKISLLLSKVKQVGVPRKVTQAWLKTIGFTSSNDGSLIGILRVSGLIDTNGVPTERWSQFRGSRGKEVLGEGIRQGYSELYNVYPDAHLRTNADLENVFSSSSKAGKQAIQKAVSTFKNLAGEAEFKNSTTEEEMHIEAAVLHAPISDRKNAAGPGLGPNAPTLHIDVQVHVSSEASAEQIDQIFSSMAKHLYGKS